jgi:AICAR transformylase/IMP cyclohydrolase PurH
MELRYGLNPEQAARASLDERHSPIRVVAGQPSYINVLDAVGAWQLVREAAGVLRGAVAASFKHLSPAGAATAGDVDQVMAGLWVPPGVDLTPVASAYVRARDCDPRSSFGDFVAVSEPVDLSLALVLRGVVSDGVIAPGYMPGAVEMLAAKKGGRFLVMEADPSFEPPKSESRELFGLRLEQDTSTAEVGLATIAAGTDVTLPASVLRDLALAMVTARYTQSNTVTYTRDGMVMGVGAGQQSRVDCTKLAGTKVDTWWLRRHEKVKSLRFLDEVRRQERINWQIRYIEDDLDPAEQWRFRAALHHGPPMFGAEEKADWLSALDGVSLASDGYIPFRDNVDHAARHGVRYIAEPGGSTRNEEVDTACAQHGIVLVTTGVRLFRH